MFKIIKGEDSNAPSTSSILMLSYVDQEEANESSSFAAIYQNSELEKEEHSHLEWFSALKVNTECRDNANNDEDNNIDNGSYMDDYLKMMELE